MHSVRRRTSSSGLVNRTSVQPGVDLSAAAAMSAFEKLRDSSDDASRTAAGLLRLHADRRLIVERETRLRARFATAHPDVATVVLPALPTDVHDLDGLRRIGALLGSEGAA
jgi:hypothetical protein